MTTKGLMLSCDGKGCEEKIFLPLVHDYFEIYQDPPKDWRHIADKNYCPKCWAERNERHRRLWRIGVPR
jgi:hypothetical protein